MRTFVLTGLAAAVGAAALLGSSGPPAPAAEARGAAAGSGGAEAAAKAPSAEPAQEHSETLGVVIREALREVEALREELAAVKHRNLELETRHAEDLITIGVLRATLTSLRAEADRLRGELAASWRWIEELDLTLTQVRADLDVAGEGPGAAVVRGGDGDRPPSGEGTDEAHRAAPAATAVGERERLGSEGDPLTGGADGDALDAGGVDDDDAYRAAATVAVNLRKRPANAAAVVAVVHKGHTVEVIGRDQGWLRVEYTDPRSQDDVTGWVYGRFLHRTAEAPQAQAQASLIQGGG